MKKMKLWSRPRPIKAPIRTISLKGKQKAKKRNLIYSAAVSAGTLGKKVGRDLYKF